MKQDSFLCAHLHVGLPCRLGRIVDTVCSEGETWCIVTPSLWRLLCRQLWACVLRSWCSELSDRRLPTLWLAPWSGLSIVSPHLQHHGPEENSDKHFTVGIKLLTKGWRVNVIPTTASFAAFNRQWHLITSWTHGIDLCRIPVKLHYWKTND